MLKYFFEKYLKIIVTKMKFFILQSYHKFQLWSQMSILGKNILGFHFWTFFCPFFKT